MPCNWNGIELNQEEKDNEIIYFLARKTYAKMLIAFDRAIESTNIKRYCYNGEIWVNFRYEENLAIIKLFDLYEYPHYFELTPQKSIYDMTEDEIYVMFVEYLNSIFNSKTK